MVEKIKEFDWPLYKIKLGTDEDLDIVRELRKHTKSIFRVDANCAWTAQQTIDYAHSLKEVNVEFIEQPLKEDNWHGMKDVYENAGLPVMADESCIAESDVRRCRGHFHGINIKLMKCGGLLPARQMIDHARSYGMHVMVGCMTESSVGISAISQLLPLIDYVDMDGPLLISNDIAKGPVFENGVVKLSKRPGTGVQLNQPWI
jgi:L-alanine-DL-glutamate epimerase-like enolase superfamily enzyme